MSYKLRPDDTARENKGFILERLKGATFDNPIAVQIIGHEIGVRDKWDLSQPKVRAVIKELIEEGHPIGSKQDGYFYITDHAQLMAYIQSLNSRIMGIKKRIDLVRKAYFKVARSKNERFLERRNRTTKDTSRDIQQKRKRTPMRKLRA